MASSSHNITNSTSQPISLVGTMGLTPQQMSQNMGILQNHQLTAHQLASIQAQQQAQQRVAAQQQVRPIVNVVSNQHGVAALQNVQVLGGANHHQDGGIGNVPISIITTGGQTYAVASQGGVPTQMQVRSIAPNAATVVNQLQTNQLAVQQVRNVVNIQQQQQQQQQQLQQQQQQQQLLQQQRISAAATSSNGGTTSSKQVQQVNLSLPLQSTTQIPSSSATSHSQILTKRKLQDLLHEIDPTETMDDDVEEVLLQIADDFIENVISSSCQIAKHRKSNTLEVKDVQLHLDRNWNMWIPGYGSEDLRPYKKLPSTEAHRQRLALIKKAMKK